MKKINEKKFLEDHAKQPWEELIMLNHDVNANM